MNSPLLSPHTKSPRSPFPHPALRSGPLLLLTRRDPSRAAPHIASQLPPSVHCLPSVHPYAVAPRPPAARNLPLSTMSASPASNTDTGELTGLAPPPPPVSQQQQDSTPPAQPQPQQQTSQQQAAQKRKASAAGMDNHGTGRSVKRRASKACQCCRARKVRCNVTEHGAPCTNCRLDEVECIVSESRRKKSVPPCGPSAGKAFVRRMSPDDLFFIFRSLFFPFAPSRWRKPGRGARGLASSPLAGQWMPVQSGSVVVYGDSTVCGLPSPGRGPVSDKRPDAGQPPPNNTHADVRCLSAGSGPRTTTPPRMPTTPMSKASPMGKASAGLPRVMPSTACLPACRPPGMAPQTVWTSPWTSTCRTQYVCAPRG